MKRIYSTARVIAALSLFVACAFTTVPALAQGASAPSRIKYPTRAVNLVVTGPAGGALDLVARTVAGSLAARLGQPFVVQNRPGGSDIIGANIVAKAPPDGYTLLFDSVTSQAINPHLFTTLPYDTERDFVQLGIVALNPYIFVGNPSMPADLREFIALAKKNPNHITVASFGFGSASHLGAELFQQLAGVKFRHVPYKGGPQAITGVVSGEVDVLFSSLSPAIPFIKSGKLRAYGATTARRTAALPDVPTIEELLGYKGFTVATELGFMAPAGTPREIVKYLNEELSAVLAEPKIISRLEPLGLEARTPRTLEQTAAHYRAEFQLWGKVIKDANIKPR